MHSKEKTLLDRKGLEQYGPSNIVVLGDSVSHGAVNGYGGLRKCVLEFAEVTAPYLKASGLYL